MNSTESTNTEHIQDYKRAILKRATTLFKCRQLEKKVIKKKFWLI